jgi:hypothetical protein
MTDGTIEAAVTGGGRPALHVAKIWPAWQRPG